MIFGATARLRSGDTLGLDPRAAICAGIDRMHMTSRARAGGGPRVNPWITSGDEDDGALQLASRFIEVSDA